ncbi:MAG TPA: PQQ-dependent sugar dehydrogenase, partial [Gaiellaceae bacterium]|nr:PQQ-dependent sugar dehydrogenase [Gaiellaceae bacterium]
MRTPRPGRRLLMLAILTTLALPAQAWAQTTPTVVDRNLAVKTVATGLSQPTGLAFLGKNDMLVNEKASGRVMRVRNGVVEGPVLDLAVNSNSERGLLGIALHRNFLVNGFVYLFWSESNTGADSTSSTAVDLLANRVDRFRWTGSALVFDRSIIRFRAFQQDAGQTARGNHDGGVVRFGPDGKVYVIVGDTGRRGQMQNLEVGPFGPGIPDDQFGGPEPDDAHFTGVIVRLNDDGSTPTDNPFYDAGAEIGGEAG